MTTTLVALLMRGSETASAVYENDERGHRTSEAYFGLRGEPVLSNQGVARVTYRFDERGNEVEQHYFGVDGMPIQASSGAAACGFWT